VFTVDFSDVGGKFRGGGKLKGDSNNSPCHDGSERPLPVEKGVNSQIKAAQTGPPSKKKDEGGLRRAVQIEKGWLSVKKKNRRMEFFPKGRHRTPVAKQSSTGILVVVGGVSGVAGSLQVGKPGSPKKSTKPIRDSPTSGGNLL